MNRVKLAAIAAILAAVANLGLAADPPEMIVLKGHTKAVSTVAWADDGKSVATASNDRTIRIWNPITGKQTVSIPGIAVDGYGGPVVAFTTDLKVVAVNYWGEITIRTMADAKAKALVTIDPILDRGQKSAFRPDVYAMAFSPDGKRLATAGSVAAVGGRHGLPGGIAIVWDVATGALIYKTDKLSTSASSVGWSADGSRVVIGTSGAGGELPESGQVLLLDVRTGKMLQNFHVKEKVKPGEWASAGDVALSPDGKWIAAPVTAGSRGTPAGLLIDEAGSSVAMWNLETGKTTKPVNGLKASVSRVAFSLDGTRLATASTDKVARVWDLESGKELATLSSPDRVEVVAFSPGGEMLAVGSQDGSVRIWGLPAAK